MGEEFSKRGGACPQLHDFMISKERDWMVRDSGGGIGVQDEKKLELKLGPPGDEDWGSTTNERKAQEPSALSLGYFPQASKPPKRGFLDTVKSKNEGCPSSSHAAGSVNAVWPRDGNLYNCSMMPFSYMQMRGSLLSVNYYCLAHASSHSQK
ncbi:auxin-responsive protein IAA18-like [Asparagus officinalis]|uniref:auxin-responsive protein IAA18-like n=1 Tax=Asparagus officinalis TaxID=4686 RepID=UPI00098E10C4|nr:auxin-responsive protein IAA18-like [Asparagus officinalis]